MLARWSGWDAVPEVFDDSKGEFAWARDQLGELLHLKNWRLATQGARVVRQDANARVAAGLATA